MSDDESSRRGERSDAPLEEQVKALAARVERLESLLAETMREQSLRLRTVERLLTFDSSPQSRRENLSATHVAAPPNEDAAPLSFVNQTSPPVVEDARESSPAAKDVSRVESIGEANRPNEASAPHVASSQESPTQPFGAHRPSLRQEPRAGAQRRKQPENAAQATAARKKDLESRIGGSLFNWIGIIAIAFGIAFFLKFAFENNWIGATRRIALGGAGSVALLALAERLRRRGYASYAFVLSGGGVLILYLSVFAAFGFYRLIGQALAFLLMSTVTAVAVLLAARYDAYAIGVLGLIGGFLTPILLSTQQDNEAGLFIYIALLDAGALALAYLKTWRSLNFMSFAATVLMFCGWAVEWYAVEKFWLTFFFLTFFFLLFNVLAVAHNLLPRRRAHWDDLWLVIANATLYFFSSYALLGNAGYLEIRGAFALLVSAFYALMFYAAFSFNREDSALRAAYLNAAALFFTIAIAIQLDQQWVTIGWALEGAALTSIGLRSKMRAPRYAALAVFYVAVLYWFTVDMKEFAYHARSADAFTPLLNRRAFSCAFLVASFFAAARLYKNELTHGGAPRSEDDETEEADSPARNADAQSRSANARAANQTRSAQRNIAARFYIENEFETFRSLFILTANALAVAALSVDINDYFAQRAVIAAAGALTNGSIEIENAKQFSFTALWVFYAVGAFFFGVSMRLRVLRYAALALLAAAGVKIILRDATFYDAAWHLPFLNTTFFAFLLFIAALVFIAQLYARHEREIEAGERELVVTILTVCGHLFALAALSLEASGYFAARVRGGAFTNEEMRNLRLARELSLSIIWAIYGGALLVLGLARGGDLLHHTKLLRGMALALLGVTILKVFFVDLSSLDRVYRITSFIVLGSILLAVSFLYQRRQRSDAASSGGTEASEAAETLK